MLEIHYKTLWKNPFCLYNLDDKGWFKENSKQMINSHYFDNYKYVCFEGNKIEFVINYNDNWDKAPGNKNYIILEPGIYKLEDGIITKIEEKEIEYEFQNEEKKENNKLTILNENKGEKMNLLKKIIYATKSDIELSNNTTKNEFSEIKSKIEELNKRIIDYEEKQNVLIDNIANLNKNIEKYFIEINDKYDLSNQKFEKIADAVNIYIFKDLLEKYGVEINQIFQQKMI